MLALVFYTEIRGHVPLAHSKLPVIFAEPALSSSTGYMGGAGNYLGASLGAGGYGPGNIKH